MQAGDYTETHRGDTETEIEGTKRLRDLVLRAVDVLESGLDSENERIRQSSAVQILKIYVGKASTMPQGWTDPEYTEQDWARVAEMSQLMGKL